MSVLVLMYHRTPAYSAEHHLDVPLPVFKNQILGLINAGVRFLRFGDLGDHAVVRGQRKVSITFDDGHVSNAAAIDFLASHGIVPTQFVVSHWAERGGEYLTRSEIARLAPACDFGAHGASHANLAKLTDEALRDELLSSRRYLEDATEREVYVMSLPGGKGNRRVVAAALGCGYRLIGNSVPMIHYRAGHCVNRVAITAACAVSRPAALALEPKSYWMKLGYIMAVRSSARALLGARAYAALRNLYQATQ
jgi:peptidoglycan/xylan/chitin deacetylase (PgdA/CDA1 family)